MLRKEREGWVRSDRRAALRLAIPVLTVFLLVATLIASGCASPAPSPTTVPAAPAAPTAAQTTTAPAAKTAAATAAPAEAVKPIELSCSIQFTSVSEQNKSIQRWADKIKTDSNGRLTIRVYPGAVLTSANDAYPGVVTGVSKLASGFKYAYDGDLGLALPVFMFGVPNETVAAKIYNDVWKEFAEFRAEWKDVKVLWITSGGPHFIHTVKREIKTLEDVKGLQLRTSGKYMAESLVAMGAKPVDLATADLLSSLQKGVIDGNVGTNDQLTSFKTADVSKYTVNFGIHNSLANFVAMNTETFSNLPADLQKVIDNSLEWGLQNATEGWITGNQAGIDYAKTKGHVFINLTPAETQKWLDVLNAKQATLAVTLDAKGLPATKMLKFVQEKIKAYSTQK